MWSFSKVIVFLISLGALSQSCCNGPIFTFKMHHRFSDPVRNWYQSATAAQENRFLPGNWPAKGSFEFYAELAHRDQTMLRGRRLSDADALLAFSDGNSTIRISSLGFLHYTTVQLGTPGVKFAVALDAGSDLFWVPCDCGNCATTQDFELSIYSPKGSSTSKKVTGNSDLCAQRDQCLGTFVVDRFRVVLLWTLQLPMVCSGLAWRRIQFQAFCPGKG